MEIILYVLFIIWVGFVIAKIHAIKEKRLIKQRTVYAKAINDWEDEQEKRQTLYWKIKNGIYD